VRWTNFVFIKFLFGFESLASITIPAFIAAFVNVTCIKNLLDESLATSMMPWLGGLDEIIETDIERAPDLLKLICHVIAVRLRFLLKLGGSPGNLDGIFVITHEEENFPAMHTLKTSLNISANFFKGCTYVRPAIGIIDGGGNEEFGRHGKRPLKENARKVVLGENNESQKVRKQKGFIKKGKR
jgi:hypothetical protein